MSRDSALRSRDGEYGRSPQLSERVFQVLSRRSSRTDSQASWVTSLSGGDDTSEFAYRRCACLFPGVFAVLGVLDVHLVDEPE